MQLRDMLLALAPLDKDWVVQVRRWPAAGLTGHRLTWHVLARCCADLA